MHIRTLLLLALSLSFVEYRTGDVHNENALPLFATAETLNFHSIPEKANTGPSPLSPIIFVDEMKENDNSNDKKNREISKDKQNHSSATSSATTAKAASDSSKTSYSLGDGVKISIQEKYFTQNIDHFTPGTSSKKYSQRYMIDHSALLIQDDSTNTDGELPKNSKPKYKYPKCIFFYAGNEAPVTKYINSTGLMYENAKKFSALVVFAEHRYWGKSIPSEDKRYLTYEQAMEDYVALITSLKRNISAMQSEYVYEHSDDKFNADQETESTLSSSIFTKKKPDIPVIAFGGSYGGMLAAWMRMTYPSVIFASVASSAPILAFPEISDFYKNGGSDYWKIVTKNAGKKCAKRVNDALQTLQRMINWHRVGPHPSEYLGICHQSQTGNNAESKLHLRSETKSSSVSWRSLNLWVAYAFDDMSMVDYPFSSNYISDDPSVFLPANPIKVACEELSKGFTEDGNSNKDDDDDNENNDSEISSWWNKDRNENKGESLLHTSLSALEWFNSEKKVRALGKAIGVFYNATKTKKCYDPPPEDDTYDGLWDYLWCDVQMPQETYFQIRGPPNDMFLKMDPIDWKKINDHCAKTWGVTQNPSRITKRYGSVEDMKLSGISRIIFTNGDLDPWSSGGIKKVDFGIIKSRTSLPVINIKGGAHHVDLMFSRKDDPAEFKKAREEIMSHLKQWLKLENIHVGEEQNDM